MEINKEDFKSNLKIREPLKKIYTFRTKSILSIPLDNKIKKGKRRHYSKRFFNELLEDIENAEFEFENNQSFEKIEELKNDLIGKTKEYIETKNIKEANDNLESNDYNEKNNENNEKNNEKNSEKGKEPFNFNVIRLLNDNNFNGNKKKNEKTFLGKKEIMKFKLMNIKKKRKLKKT